MSGADVLKHNVHVPVWMFKDLNNILQSSRFKLNWKENDICLRGEYVPGVLEQVSYISDYMR